MGAPSDVKSARIGKKLILEDAVVNCDIVSGKKIRIIFDGRSSFEPVISNLILTTKAPVNILYASTRDIKGKAYGQMVFQIPGDDAEYKRVAAHLDSMGINYEEVTDYDMGQDDD